MRALARAVFLVATFGVLVGATPSAAADPPPAALSAADLEAFLDQFFDQPVTVAHLVTHTAGFDDSFLGLLPWEAEDVVSVSEFLTRYGRRVVFQPGTVHAYSNYGSLMARYVVDRVTGIAYEDYLL